MLQVPAIMHLAKLPGIAKAVTVTNAADDVHSATDGAVGSDVPIALQA
ncbi:MAG: hypothetical protein QOG53_2416 [Frankiales bacterium]|nr:hypothetical protein [Frankiales bacterium]